MKKIKYALLFSLISVFAVTACSDDDNDFECPVDQPIPDYSNTTCSQDCRQPVCGCNNVTYCNECAASQAGVRVLYPFACGQYRDL